MTRVGLFALFLAMIGLALSCLALLEAKATNNGLPFVSAAYQSCAPHLPIQPNKPNYHPYGRKADLA